MQKKAQSAVEFLTTYSWAIMIILLTIGALSYFNVFNTSRFVAEKCETGAQISCREAALTQEGIFYIHLTNNYPVDIEINRIELRQGTKSFTSPSSTTTINRAANTTINFDLEERFSRNKETFDITITFKRRTGANNYNITGTIVTKPLPDGLI